jgi:hypothetical protein
VTINTRSVPNFMKKIMNMKGKKSKAYKEEIEEIPMKEHMMPNGKMMKGKMKDMQGGFKVKSKKK